MTVEVNSAALEELQTALGLAGNPASSTQLDDGNLTQVIDIARIARRSLAFGDGLWYLFLDVIHTAGNAVLQTDIDPYAAINGSGGARRGYPFPVPRGFDLYLIKVSLATSAQLFQDCSLGAFIPDNSVGVGVTNTNGVQTTAGGPGTFPLAAWTAETPSIGGSTFGLTGTGQVLVPIGERIRRGTLLRFVSEISVAGAHTNSFRMSLGLFPSTLGQDVAV